MPRYYFHISHGDDLRLRDEGIELPNAEAAWVEATSASGEILRDLNGSLKPGDVWLMIVKDETGAELFHLEFSTRQIR
jgi:hypothetical protein